MIVAATQLALLGRSKEVDRLAAELAMACEGSGRVALVEGEAGIGKTTLVTAALDIARSLGFHVLHAAADELDQRRPFGALADCLGIGPGPLDPVRAKIADLLFGDVPWTEPADFTPDGTGNDFRVAEAMLRLMESLGNRGPLVIVIEDLQWADPSTCLVLHRLSREIEHRSTVVVLTCRPSPRSTELEQLIQSLGRREMTHLPLKALPDDAVADLVASRLDAVPGPALLANVATAGGNPLFVTELVAALKQEGWITTEGGQAEVRTANLPSSLNATILRRLSILPKDTVDLLRLASVLGSTFRVRDLGLFVRKSAPVLAGTLREAILAGVLLEKEEVLTFRHELIRDALYSELGAPLRAALHREAAGALSSACAPAVRVAEHLMRGASPGDRDAAVWLRKAGHEVAPCAPGTAIGLFQKAVEIADVGDPLREELLADQAMALAWSGRFAEAEVICRDALRRYQEPACEISFRMCLVQALLPGGHTAAALDEIEEAVASPSLSRAERARLQAWGSICRLALCELDWADELARMAAEEAEALPDDLTLCICLATQVAVSHFRGLFDEATELSQKAVELGDRSRNREGHRFPLNLFRGWFLMALDRIDEGQQALEHGRRIVEELGIRGTLVPYHWASALGYYWSGAWDDALAECAVARELAEDIGTHQGMLYSYALNAIIALRRGNMEMAEQSAATAEQEFLRTGPQFGAHWMFLARSLLLEATGSVNDAYAILCAAWDALSSAGMVSELPVLGPDLVRLAIGQGDRTRAEEAAVALEDLASKAGVSSLSGIALRCRGLLEQRATILAEAVGVLRASPRPLDLAIACEDAAALAVQSGDTEGGRRLFNEAVAIYERLEASRDAGRAESRMRACGLRRGRRERRNRPKTGWEALTWTEMKVVTLVAEGLTNPEIAERMFISRRTVATHVSGALAKVGVSSRVALAAEVARRID